MLSNLQNRLSALNTAVQNEDTKAIDELLDQIDAVVNNINGIIAGINTGQISSTVTSLLDQVIDTIGTAQGALSKADQIDFDSLLSSTKATVTNAVAILEKYQKEMPAIGQEIHDANTMLNGNMDTQQKKVTSLHNLLSYKPMRFIQSQITVQLAPRFILHYVCGSALFFFQVLLRQNTI